MSTHPTTTPELHWPSKCRWSMESPLQTKSIGMISHEETIAGSDLSSTCPTLSDVNEDMEYQIDFIDQGFK